MCAQARPIPRAAPVDKVAEVIEEAVTASRPRARYVVGLDARIQIGLRIAAAGARVRRAAGQDMGVR